MKLPWLIFLLKFSLGFAVHLKNHPDLTITVALSERKPFVILDGNATPTGLDVLIIENFARKFNLKIKYIIMNTSMNDIFIKMENSTSFANQNSPILKADIVIGGLDGNIPANEYFTISNAYFFDILTWCVQERQPITPLQNIFHLCTDPFVWLLYALTAFASYFTAYYLQRFEASTLKMDAFEIILAATAISISMIHKYRAINHSNRVFYAFACMAGILHTIVILTGSMAILMNPIYEDQINSIAEILDDSFEIVGDSFALHHIMRKNEVSLK